MHKRGECNKTNKAFERIIKVFLLTDNVLEIVQSIYLTLSVEVAHCLKVAFIIDECTILRIMMDVELVAFK